jgi:AcrR family transcriptional regulator
VIGRRRFNLSIEQRESMRQVLVEETMFDVEGRTLIKRIPQQERSQARFETVLKAALHLFAAHGYESTSMREIAREAGMPIATVYQYFPMKLAIVREMWTRYTSTITETLTKEIHKFLDNSMDDWSHLNHVIIDKMAELQASNPAFIEIWSCVTASMELRALNVEDTLHNARSIAGALRQRHPECDASALFDRALIAIEAASATTRLALTLPEPHRARVLRSLKAALSVLLDPKTLEGTKVLPPEKKRHRGDGSRNARTNGKVRPAKSRAKHL